MKFLMNLLELFVEPAQKPKKLTGAAVDRLVARYGVKLTIEYMLLAQKDGAR